jgi:hypothetical protein
VLAFTTERIVCSLADIMTRFSSISGGASQVAEYLEGYLEVRKCKHTIDALRQ